MSFSFMRLICIIMDVRACWKYALGIQRTIGGWMAKGPSGRGQGIAVDRTGCLRAPNPITRLKPHTLPSDWLWFCLAYRGFLVNAR